MDLENVEVQTSIQEILCIINEEEEVAARVVQECLHATWMIEGDRCSKLFFREIKARSQANRISTILDEDGNTLTTTTQILPRATTYF